MTRKKVPVEGFVLSERQTEILAGIGRGDPYGAIAKRLSISPSTVGYHVGRLQQKLNAGTVPALIVLAIVAGILTNDQLPIQPTGNLLIDPGFLPD